MDLVKHLEGRLLLAVPKKGRLQAPTLRLLEGCDIQFRRSERLDIALVKNHNLAIIFLPAADIPKFVGRGRVDLGITGNDQVAEYHAHLTDRIENEEMKTVGLDESVEEVADLGFGRCKLQVQVPERGGIKDVRQLLGKSVVTSFVSLTEKFFRDLESKQEGWVLAGRRPPQTDIDSLSGSVETACALGVADGIVDLVESGETMQAAGLKAIETVVESTAVLIKGKRVSNPQLVDLIATRIRGVITAHKYILTQYNIPRSLLSKATLITPGKRAPTITALEDPDWVAVSSMVEKERGATVMDQLTQVGATDVLCLEIVNSRSG